MTEPDASNKTILPAQYDGRPGIDKGNTSSNDHLALPVGTHISEFEITGLVGIGGFGIVYLARDNSLGRVVALKEYMPSSLANRIDGITVLPRSVSSAETFTAGLRSFINEARMLALFDHPALVKVYRFWEANGTAYMVMPYYDGQTLKHAVSNMTTPPTEEWLYHLLMPLLDALEIIHEKSCFHRDIAPDNILLLKNGQPVLLDFGAARQVIGDMANNLTVILKPGYAPIEQYAGDANMPQGAWTDIYALGAVIHFVIMGAPPLVSVSRLIKDNQVPLEHSAQGRYSARFLKAIDQTLAVRQADRPQTIAELRKLLVVPAHGPVPVPIPVPAPLPRKPIEPPVQPTVTPNQARKSISPLVWGGAATVLMAMTVAVYFWVGADDDKVATTAAPPPSIPPAPRIEPTAPVIEVPAQPTMVAAPFDAASVLDQVIQLREIDHIVSVDVDKARLIIGKDRFRFSINSAKGGYAYVLMLGTSHELNLLFPNTLDQNNKIKAGQTLTLPGRNWAMIAPGPAGRDEFVVLVSDQPRTFTSAGLKKTGVFGEFPINALRQVYEVGNAKPGLLAGEPTCLGKPDCSSNYGAVKFSIEETTP